MTDVRLQSAFFTHPKTKKLERRCGCSGVLAFLRLWTFCAENSDRTTGDLSGMDDEDIEIAADWSGPPGEFVQGLADVGFLDGDEGTYAIHDWSTHQPWSTGRSARSAASVRANHIRWHKKGRHGEKVDGCPLCYPDSSEAESGSDPDRRPGRTNPESPLPFPSLPSPSFPSPSLQTTTGRPGDPPGDAPPPGPPQPALIDSPATKPPSAEQLLSGRFDGRTKRSRMENGLIVRGLWGAFAESWPPGRKPRAMNDARRKKIKRALADYEPSQVAKALIGVASSTWWRGEDDPSQYRGGKPPSVDNAFTHAMNLDRIESCIDSFEGRGPEPAANHPGGMSPDEVKRRKEAAKAKWEANRAEG